MRKGELTRTMILAQSAQLFSRKGYFGSSFSDIMHETGLKKGGIYNHFESKDQLALEAFDYSFGLILQRESAALEKEANAVDRLLAIITVFQGLVDNPPLVGGCPVLNTAIEADDAHPALRERACCAMNHLRTTICGIVEEGIEKGEIRPEIDVDALATVLLATLEGAIMMSKLYSNRVHMYRVVDHLTIYINSVVRL